MAFRERLSEHVQSIFKEYTNPGLHICDIATGGGKSYTIGKLTCEFYPNHFDRIIILCVQNKLVDSMEKDLRRFISSRDSLINSSDMVVIQSNVETLKNAIDHGTFTQFLDHVNYRINEFGNDGFVNSLRYSYKRILKIYEAVKNLVLQNLQNNDVLQSQIAEGELQLRNAVRVFFELYKKHENKRRNCDNAKIIREFPYLTEVYPQVEFKKKKVLLMTVQKAMYGIDPILSEKISIHDFIEKGKKTLILFDESDQAAIAMRSTIIEQSIESAGGSKRYIKGYNGYLQYKGLLEKSDQITDEYHDNLSECIKRAKNITGTNWNRIFGDIKTYQNIFLGDIEEMEDFRRGVFFSGPALRLNVSKINDKKHSFVCYDKGDKYFKIYHVENDIELKKQTPYVVPMDKFLSTVIGNTTTIKAQLCNVIFASFKKSLQNFFEQQEELKTNTLPKDHYYTYPTREREIHTLISRFEPSSEYQFEQQLLEFMTNRKNLIATNDDEHIKLPDYSVYSQGIQLYQEEVDERDNQHRVRLSCREIATTPEKILFDLVNTEGTSVVLCSATASSASVISNFDITYLKQVLGNRVHTLSLENKQRFDDLVSKTYPVDHKIEVIPLERYEYEDKRENKLCLPKKYKEMFSVSAQEEGLPDMWFRCTTRELQRNKKENEDITFKLYRLYQFIEAYSWFIKNDDVHSMLYFQNRIGDEQQTHVLSCLIDGTYKDQTSEFDDELPRSWKNEHISITRDWEEVEEKILKELSSSKDVKIMLVSAYASFKAGANMQYSIPKGADVLHGDNWNTEDLKKDWDAIYLQCPSAYLMMSEDGNEYTFEKSLYNAMLSLMMLYERGCLSKSEVASWLSRALSNCFWFGDRNNPGIARDKSAWALNILEQAVGRLCRTRNKPRVTHILFDKDMIKFFDNVNQNNSQTKEFKTLSEFIASMSSESEIKEIDNAEIIRCNNANYAKRCLDRMRKYALRFLPHPGDDEEEGDFYNVDIPRNVLVNQIMNQSYKQTIIKKPVISNFDELTEEDKQLTFICKCYGEWKRNENNEYTFSYDPQQHNNICPKGTGKDYPDPVSPKTVRLDVLMKNKVIYDYFKEKGYATTWKEGDLILHPDILKTDYAGEIGEEAFKAIVLHYTNCTEESFKHMEGKYYEYADFVLCNPDGSYKLAFDVKNMNPNVRHDDKSGDLPTAEKRKIKIQRLNCQIVTVNMLKLNDEAIDGVTEIHGVIDENGNVIQSSIETLKKLFI